MKLTRTTIILAGAGPALLVNPLAAYASWDATAGGAVTSGALDANQRSQAGLARDSIGKIDLLTTWLPLVGLLVGLVLIAAGLIITVAGERDATRATREQEPPAEADAPQALA